MKLDTSCVLEYQVENYFIDIAFPERKLGIELDGKEFHKDKTRDEKRDDWLKAQGWEIYRIPSEQCWNPKRLAWHLKRIFEKISNRPLPFYIAELLGIEEEIIIRKPKEPLYDKCLKCKSWHELLEGKCNG